VEEGDAHVCAKDLVGEVGTWRDGTGVKISRILLLACGFVVYEQLFSSIELNGDHIVVLE
jgi:hypothetical protein